MSVLAKMRQNCWGFLHFPFPRKHCLPRGKQLLRGEQVASTRAQGEEEMCPWMEWEGACPVGRWRGQLVLVFDVQLRQRLLMKYRMVHGNGTL